MECLPDYKLIQPETDCSFTCHECGEYNEVVIFRKVKPAEIGSACKFCGAKQNESSNEPDDYDVWRDREPDED